MKTIETSSTVTANGTLSVSVPVDLPPGKVRVVLMIEEEAAQGTPENGKPVMPVGFGPYGLPIFPVSASSPKTYRREELYGDDGR